MDKKKMGKKGASSRDTVSKTIEGSNDIRQPGSGTVSRQSQSENSSQSKSASGENYRENRENLLTDNSRSTEVTPVDPIGGSTTNMSADKRISRSSDHMLRDDSSSSGRDSSESDRHRAGFHPPGHLGLSQRIGLYNTDPRTGHLGTGHQTGHLGTGHRIGHLDTNHRAGYLDTGHRAGHLDIDLRAGHIVPDLVIGLILYRHSSSRRHGSKIKHKYSRSKRQRHHRYTSPSSYGSSSRSRSESVSSEWSTSSDRNRHHKRKKSHRRRSISTYRRHKRHKHSSGSRHRGRARSPEFCPRKQSSETIQRPRSTLDALNPTEDKNSASLPQSLLIKDVVNVFQSLIDKKVKLEPGWVTNQSFERELGIVMKYY